MIAEFKCPACLKVGEEYFPTFKGMEEDFKTKRCEKCNTLIKRVYGTANIKMGGVIPGYEKENEGCLTLGKAIDKKQKSLNFK